MYVVYILSSLSSSFVIVIFFIVIIIVKIIFFAFHQLLKNQILDFRIGAGLPQVRLESPNFHILILLWICVFHLVHNFPIQLNFEDMLKIYR